MSVVYVLATPMLEDSGDDATVELIRKRAKWDNDDYVCKGLILNGMSDSLFDINQNVESSKELWESLEAKYMAEDASSKKFLVSNFTNYKMTDSRPVLEQYNELLGIHGRFTQHKMNMDESIQDSDKPKGNNVASPSVLNMVEHNNSSKYNDNKGKRKHHDNTKVDPNKKSKVTCWKCGKPGHLKKNCKGGKVGNKVNGSGTNGSVDGSTNSLKGATIHVCKDRCWFKTYELLNDGSILHMGNESTAPVHGRGCVDLKFSSKKIVLLFNVLHHARLGHVHFKRMQDMSKDGLILAFDMDTEKCKACMLNKITKKPFQNVKRETKVLELIHSDLCDLHATPLLRNKKYFVIFIDDASRAVVRLLDPKLKTLGERGIECIFVGYAEHSKAFRFYVIEPNDSVSINSIIESRDAIFDENRFSSVPRPSLRISNGTKDIGGLVVPEEIDSIMDNNTWVLADLPPGCKPLGFKWIFKRKLKVDETIEKFKASTIRLLIAMASIHNLIIHQMDVKIAFLNADKCVYIKFDEFGKGVIICLYVDDMLIFGTDQVQVDLTKEFLSSKFFMKNMKKADVIFGIRIKHGSNGIAISQSYYIEKVLKKFNYFDCTLVSTPMDTSEKLMPNNGQAVSQLEYSRLIGCLMYAMTCTRPDIAFVVGKVSRYTSNPSTQHWQAIQRVISDWVFLLGGGAISWASKKQTCITGSTIKYEFVALAAAGKKAEWLRNLILEIPLWSKLIAPISIRCDSAATLAKAYSQMYNGKSRHLGIKHNMIREMITNRLISIEFVRSQQNLAGHFTKGLARDLVIKSAEGMRLKSN
ncbi:zinc finger, CCHC-type containing protein [Tanacetum coccineum]